MMTINALRACVGRRELPAVWRNPATVQPENSAQVAVETEMQTMISTQDSWCRAVLRRTLPLFLVLGLLAGGASCRSAPAFGRGEDGKAADTVKLKPGLMISMSVLVAGKKELDEPAKRISEGGTIVLPLLGELEIADKNLEELQADLTKAYRKFFVDPQVILDFARDAGTEGSSPWGFVTVLGRVKTPGRVPVPATRDMTVSSAIQKAGGFAPSAKDSAILVTRSLANGQTESRTINLRAVGTAGRLEDDIVLDANDVVYVPEALF